MLPPKCLKELGMYYCYCYFLIIIIFYVGNINTWQISTQIWPVCYYVAIAKGFVNFIWSLIVLWYKSVISWNLKF